MNNYHKYFPISSMEEKWGLYINTAGYSRINSHSNYPVNNEHPNSHSFSWNKGRILSDYYLVFISKGEGVFESAVTKPAHKSEGECFLLYPGIWHRYKPDPAFGWEEYWIGFNGSYPSDLMHKGFFSPEQPLINVGMCCDLLNLFHFLIEKMHSSSSGHPQVIAGIALQILGVVMARSMNKDHENNALGILIDKAKFLLQESIEHPVDMELLARNLPMGYSAFRKDFKKITGQSPNQYHLNLRLNKAKDLLTSTLLSISKIAHQTGFDSIFYFSKLFKKKNGKSPKSYRTEIIDFKVE